MKDLKTALKDLAKAKGFKTDGLSDKELFQLVTGIQQPSDEMMSGEFASWYVPGGAAVEQEESETESNNETPAPEPTDDPVNPTTEPTDDPVNPTTEPTDDPVNPTTEPTDDPVNPTTEPTDDPVTPTDEPENPSNSTVTTDGD